MYLIHTDTFEAFPHFVLQSPGIEMYFIRIGTLDKAVL